MPMQTSTKRQLDPLAERHDRDMSRFCYAESRAAPGYRRAQKRRMARISRRNARRTARAEAAT